MSVEPGERCYRSMKRRKRVPKLQCSFAKRKPRFSQSMQNRHYVTLPNSKIEHSQTNRSTTQNRPQKLKKTSLTKAFSTPKTKKSRNIQIFLHFTCMVYFFDIPLHHQTRRDHILVEKQTLERWQSGRLHRS